MSICVTFAGMAVFLFPYNYEFCRAYERTRKNTRIFLFAGYLRSFFVWLSLLWALIFLQFQLIGCIGRFRRQRSEDRGQILFHSLTSDFWRGVGAAYRAGFENRCALFGYRGFESRPLRFFVLSFEFLPLLVAGRGQNSARQSLPKSILKT